MHTITSLATVITECLDCWNGLCLRDGNTPNCATTQNDCIDYGGVNRTGPMLAQPDNYLLCCEAAGGYVDTVFQNLTQLTLDSTQSSSCSSSYNEQSEGNFNRDNFNTLEQQTQYVFPSIQFGCKGCISNVTFYTRSQQQPADFTIFNILLWGHHRNFTENSEVFELKLNRSVNVTEPLTFMDWSIDSYRTTITLGNRSICFNPVYVFGLSVSGTREFNLEVFREKSSSVTATVYSRIRQSCESLGTLFYAKPNHNGGNVLVAVGVREESVTSVIPIQTSTSFSFETSTLSAVASLSTTSAILISTNAPIMSTPNLSTTLPVSSSPLYVQDNAIILATVAPILAILMISTTILVTIILVVFLRRNCKKSRIVQHPAAALSTIADDQAVDLELQENYLYQQYVLQSQLIMRMFSVITFAPHKQYTLLHL